MDWHEASTSEGTQGRDISLRVRTGLEVTRPDTGGEVEGRGETLGVDTGLVHRTKYPKVSGHEGHGVP